MMHHHPLFAHRFLLRAAFAMANVFAWVFVFHYFYMLNGSIAISLGFVALAYAAAQTVAFFLTPLAARSIKNGTRRALIFGTLAYLTALYGLASAFFDMFGTVEEDLFFGLGAFIIFTGVYRALYFIPYAVEKEMLSTTPENNRFMLELFIASLPIAAGLLASMSGFGPHVVLIVAVLLSLLSLAPLYYIPTVYERFSWSYLGTLAALLDPHHQRALGMAVLQGISGVGLLLWWPLTIFLTFERSYMILGLLLSLTLVALLIAHAYVRPRVPQHLLDSKPIQTTLTASGWILRFSPFSPLIVVLADVSHHLGMPHRAYAIDAAAFEQVSDGGYLLDEITALKEMGLAAGRILACLIVASLIGSDSLYLILGVGLGMAAFASLAPIFLRSRAHAF